MKRNYMIKMIIEIIEIANKSVHEQNYLKIAVLPVIYVIRDGLKLTDYRLLCKRCQQQWPWLEDKSKIMYCHSVVTNYISHIFSTLGWRGVRFLLPGKLVAAVLLSQFTVDTRAKKALSKKECVHKNIPSSVCLLYTSPSPRD